MKKLSALLFVLAAASTAQATDVGFDLNINIGNRPKVVAPAPSPAPVIVVEEPPEFIYPSSLGFYVAVGVPYDIFYVSNTYYLYRGNVWYRAAGYNGPWVVVRHDHLPRGLRKHKYEKIRMVRDEEYRIYREDRDRYRGRHFKPGKERKERHKEERGRDKEHKHKKHDD